jgi:uncharacterized protein (TIGR03000 family)
MYSVVLMAALTANTAEAPAWFRHASMGCCGGLYAHSGQYASCMGCWGACWGSGRGCYGSCYGSCSGCCGGCWGASYGGYSGGCYGCMGCYGSWFGYGDAMMPGAVGYPGMNPMAVPGSTTMPGATTPPATTNPGGAAPGAGVPPAGGGGVVPPINRGGGDTAAKLIIEKPADAKVYVDDHAVKSEGVRNSFSTPSLDPTQTYYYMVRVEMTRDGKPVSETRRVVVRAGETVQETFREPTVATAALTIPPAH